MAGLRYLRGQGPSEVMLHVESDNAAALATHERLGFTRFDGHPLPVPDPGKTARLVVNCWLLLRAVRINLPRISVGGAVTDPVRESTVQMKCHCDLPLSPSRCTDREVAAPVKLALAITASNSSNDPTFDAQARSLLITASLTSTADSPDDAWRRRWFRVVGAGVGVGVVRQLESPSEPPSVPVGRPNGLVRVNVHDREVIDHSHVLL